MADQDAFVCSGWKAHGALAPDGMGCCLDAVSRVRADKRSVGFAPGRAGRTLLSAIAIGGTLAMLTPGAASARSAKSVLAWGYYGIPPKPGPFFATPTPVAENAALGTAVQVADGDDHTLVLLKNGTIVSWGSASAGQLGGGLIVDARRDTPTNVVGISSATMVSAGRSFSLALLRDGTIRSWGTDKFGNLGTTAGATSNCNGPTQCAWSPVTVSGITGANPATDISAGYAHSLAVLKDGKVMAWGNNTSGQLGQNPRSIQTSATPQPVLVGPGAPLGDVIQVSAGGSYPACGYAVAGHSLALRKDGTVMAWGANCNGQLASKSKSNSATPIEVKAPGASGTLTPLTRVAEVAAGGAHSLALLSNGTLMAWGNDQYGQLGYGKVSKSSTSRHARPVQVEVRGTNGTLAPLTGVVAIGAGQFDSYARQADGTVWAWGRGTSGELGDGQRANSSTAVQVSLPRSMTADRIGTGSSTDYQLAITAPVGPRPKHKNHVQDYLG
jgi:alpha-tubulin suppressor-like RCC1 family protein